MLLVQDRDLTHWRRAARTAEDHTGGDPDAAVLFGRFATDARGVDTIWAEVESASRDSLRHRVDVRVDGEGLHVGCTCEAGSHRRICWHAAATVIAAELWPLVEVV